MKYAGVIFAITLAACSGTKSGVSSTDSTPSRFNVDTLTMNTQPQSLADILVRLPGVYVDANAFGTRVTIRGAAPLFIVDSVPVGNTYESAASVVSVYDITSVEVVKDAAELAIYGMRGRNGVIVIRTR